MSNNNNEHLDDPAFEELFFLMFPELCNTNLQDNIIDCFPVTPWNNNAASDQPLPFYNDWNNTQLQNQLNVIPTNHVPPPEKPNIIADIQPNLMDQSLNVWNNAQFLDGPNNHVPLPTLQDQSLMFQNGWNNTQFLDGPNNHVPLPTLQDQLLMFHNGQHHDGISNVHLPDKKRGRWTEDEHKLFLLGVKMYGRGNWKDIENIVKSRTSTQIASHAQKYFLHQQESNQKRKRKSMHDITLQNNDHISLHNQIRVSSPNLAMQQLYFDNTHQQNWNPSLNAAMNQQFRCYPIPHHIHQKNLIPRPNLGMQQNTRNNTFTATNQHGSSSCYMPDQA